jgi:hypothetical protein
MHVLVATSATQGARPTDYCHCIAGELVWLAPPCADDAQDPDGPCGCGRAFAGMSSHRATTTGLVADLPIVAAEVELAFADSLTEQGYSSACARELTAELLWVAAQFPLGAVLERRSTEINLRTVLPDGAGAR